MRTITQPIPQLQASSSRASGITTAESLNPAFVVFFILIHFPLALVMKLVPFLATIHALFTFFVGLLWLLSPNSTGRVIYVIGYIAGAEILWRGAEASIFWEFGKYSVTLLLILALLKNQSPGRRPIWPIFYFVLLLPSIVVLPVFDRQAISYNLSGPLALAVATFFFSSVSLSASRLKTLLLSIIAPIAGLGFLTAYYIYSAEAIAFGQGSLLATSAEIGPNQVSSTLGLGALAAAYYAFVEKKSLSIRALIVGITILLLIQSVLTFSRGGLWTTFGALLVFAFFSLRDRKVRLRSMILAIILTTGFLLIFPYANEFSGGALGIRVQDTNPTGRDRLVQEDWQIFLENPWFGVGPNQSKYLHVLYYRGAFTHTEYSRMLAEHGIFGLVSLVILVWASIQRYLSKAQVEQWGFRVLFTTWALLYMIHSAMRLVAPAFLFGLGAARIILDEEDEQLENSNHL